MEVSEQGALNRVGFVDELGEAKFKLEMNAVSVNNLAHILGTPFDPTTSGQTFSVSVTDFNNARLDIMRMVADGQNNIYGSLYMQDGIIDDYTISAKTKGMATETINGRVPNATFFPGFFCPKTYLVSSADVTNGYLTVSNVIGTDEQPVEIYLPTVLTTPTSFTATGSGTGGTIAAGTYFYRMSAVNGIGETLASIEHSVTTTGTTSSVALACSTVTGATSYNIYRGSDSGAETLYDTSVSDTYTDTGAPTHSNAAKTLPFLNTTAVPSYWQQNGAQYFLKIERIPGGSLTANPIRYYEANSPNGKTATYNHTNTHLTLSDTLVDGDVFRLVFVSYNTDTVPTTVPANTTDSTQYQDRAGIPDRMIPININAAFIDRVQSADLKLSLKRDHVQGLGENTIIYGPTQIPDVELSFDIKETDLTLLSLLSTGSANLTSQGGTIANDWQDLNYITRVNLATIVPFSIVINDPYNVGTTLATYSCPQIVVKSIAYSSTNKSDNTVKVSASSVTGSMSVSYVVPA
jgi:hypothetical protein